MVRDQAKPIVEGTSERTATDWHVELCVRDLFACAALAGLLAFPGSDRGKSDYARAAFELADAMMAVRGRSRPRPGR